MSTLAECTRISIGLSPQAKRLRLSSSEEACALVLPLFAEVILEPIKLAYAYLQRKIIVE